MSEVTRYRPNSPPVLHETIDHETIIVNLEVGTYYSLNPSGTSVWEGLQQGSSVEQIVRSLADQAGMNGNAIDGGVRSFVEQLAAEQLVVAQDETPAGDELEVTWPAHLGFEPPLLSCYTDMQELLLLDPVHDVGVAGWPESR